MSSEEKTKVTVVIHGVPYKLSGTTDAKYVKRVAALVDQQMTNVERLYPRLDMARLAILSAVNISDEFLKSQELLDELMANHSLELSQATRAAHEEIQKLQEQLQATHKELLALQKDQSVMQEKIRKAEQQWERERSTIDHSMDELERLREERLKRQEDGRLLLEQVQRAQDLLSVSKEDNIRLKQQLKNTEEEKQVLKQNYDELRIEHDEWIKIIDKSSN